MLDIKFIRENAEVVRQSMNNRGKDSSIVDQFLQLDEERRELQGKIDDANAQKNIASKEIAGGGDKDQIRANMKKLGEEMSKHQDRYKELTPEWELLLSKIPNVPRDDVPVGKDENENVVIRSWGEPTVFDFEPKDHAELGKLLDVIDNETSAKISGARFTYIKRELVLVQWALMQFAMNVLVSEEKLKEVAKLAGKDFNTKPFIPMLPPVMVREDVYMRTSRMTEEKKEDMYGIADDNLWLIGSAEHSLAPLHLDETLELKDLPLRYVGYSTAFRREAGTYGKDMKGILRLHQFDKLEMFSFNHPDESDNEQEFFIAIQEYLMQSIGLPYQVVNVCTGDMGMTNARHIDIEVWLPGQNKYRETHTADMNTDYQSRGLNTKVKLEDGKKVLVHTNDATAFSQRPLIAILENYQQADGSVKVPEVLVPFTGFTEIKPKKSS